MLPEQRRRVKHGSVPRQGGTLVSPLHSTLTGSRVPVIRPCSGHTPTFPVLQCDRALSDGKREYAVQKDSRNGGEPSGMSNSGSEGPPMNR
jgi:hypothetical protein